jgi:Fe-S-cluster containining protein
MGKQRSREEHDVKGMRRGLWIERRREPHGADHGRQQRQQAKAPQPRRREHAALGGEGQNGQRRRQHDRQRAHDYGTGERCLGLRREPPKCAIGEHQSGKCEQQAAALEPPAQQQPGAEHDDWIQTNEGRRLRGRRATRYEHEQQEEEQALGKEQREQ